MSLNSAMKLGRLLSLQDTQLIFQAAQKQLANSWEKDNCSIYEGELECPGEPSCSAQEVLLAVTTATMEHFSGEAQEAFDDMRAYAVK